MSALPLFATEPFAPRPLHPHQCLAIAMLKRSLLAGNKRIVLQMPTGAGKTRTAAEIVLGALSKGNRICFTVPKISLVDQTIAALELEGIDQLGVIQASHPRTHYAMPVQIASVQSLARRAIPPCEVVVVDEAHLQSAVVREWMRREPNKVFIGLSATPWARGMASDWQGLLIPVRMQELIDQGLLSPFRVFAPSHPDMSGVRTIKGDYEDTGSAEVMGGLVADVVQTWIQQAERRPTLIFAVNRAHAAHLQREFAAAGVKMGYCDAHVDLIERKMLFDRMADGELSGIVNVGTLTTGVDADIRCIVMARPTKSEMLFVQCIGRGLRTAPGKIDCLILDHADNHARLGFVTDIHHDKLLDGRGKNSTRKEQGEPMPKECGSCHALKPPKARECPFCGFTPIRQSDVKVEEGELVEIRTSPKLKPTMDAKQAFWSMALWVDRERGKSGKLAKALYRGKYGVWPKDLSSAVVPPSPEFLSYEHSRRIAFARSKGADRENT